MSYQLIENKYPYQQEHIIRLSDNAFIPKDESNNDYQQYLKWLEEGNEPLPPDPTPTQEPLTSEQKLQQSGLTVEELKELLGLS